MPLPDAEPGAHNDHFDWRINLVGIGAAMPQLCSFPTDLLGARFERPLTVIAGADSDYVRPARRRGIPSRCSPQVEIEVHRRTPATGCMPTSPAAFLALRAARAAARRQPAAPRAEPALDNDNWRPRHDRQPARSRARLPPLPHAGQDLGHADQGDGHAARPVAGLLARRRRCLHGDRRRPARGRQPDRAQQPGGRHHQRHGGARPGQHRPAGRQAGDGRQGLPVQEVRRHRRVRHRAGRERPRHADRDHRAHGAHLRRHQPRGHQGARVLLHRDEAARAHEDPGLPRRPARHRHRRRGGDPERAEARGQGHRRGEARGLGRRRGGAGLPGPDR